MSDSGSILLLPPLTTYGVSAAARRGIIEWFLGGLRLAGARIVTEPDPRRAPFVSVIELPWSGERLGIVAYLFTSTSRQTRNRPDDEARFQIKYGSEQDDNLHRLFDDRHGLWTTLMWGIDTENGLAVSVDPLAHSPTKFFISVEYKHRRMEAVARDGWHVWDRDRRAWSSGAGDIREEEQATTETLVGATQARALDLVLFERAARGLPAAYRHTLADQWLRKQAKSDAGVAEHEVIEMLGLEPEDLLDMITSEPRLSMAVRGFTAQRHLAKQLSSLPIVDHVRPMTRDHEPDVEVTLANGAGNGRKILLECKNTLRPLVRGLPKVDFQRTRAPQGNPCGRYYAPTDFHILAACLHPVTSSWEFRFKMTAAMEKHPRCPDRLNHNILVDGTWSPDLAEALAAV